jgi:hypothetical protein
MIFLERCIASQVADDQYIVNRQPAKKRKNVCESCIFFGRDRCFSAKMGGFWVALLQVVDGVG